ncbi:MAG: hypothetical protein IJU16_03090 [Clostridia bacterium]|nr:hypothetical protein [Clostridia bacterium]
MRYVWIILCIACLLALCLPVAFASADETQTLTFGRMHGYYHTLGRTVEQANCLYMDDVASGFEVYFEGRGDVTLTATVLCNSEFEAEQYLLVAVDGQSSRVRVSCSQKNVHERTWIKLASGLSQGAHHIEVYRQTEAQISLCCAEALTFTGHLLSGAPDKPLVIDVIGDSLSGGYGCLWNSSLGVADPGDNDPYYEDGTQTYAFFAGKTLGADVRVTQTSGYGCVAGWNGRDVNLQMMYPITCWWRDQTSAYAFDPQADVVVINLGDNDYATRSANNLSNAEFKAGAKNLMQMARNYNLNAKIVWCTGMSGVFYQNEITAAQNELGGEAAGYYFLILPKGMSGAVTHPTVAQQRAAGDVLSDFLLNTVLPSDYTSAKATAEQLRSAINTAKAATQTATIAGAVARAETELAVGTTDPYRLGARRTAIENALAGDAGGLSLMPKEGISKTPIAKDGVSYIWPYYGYGDGSVALYKGGDGFYWPQITTAYNNALVDIDETPYWRIDFASDTAFNISLTYRKPDGELAYVNAATLSNIDSTDLPAHNRGVLTVDFGAYIRQMGHADSEGLVPILYCDMFVIGQTDTCVRLYDCRFTDEAGDVSTITGRYSVKDGVLGDIPAGTTADRLINMMDQSASLVVKDAKGNTVTGLVGTGMTLELIQNGAVVDRVIIAVTGDVTGDGRVTSVDARAVLRSLLGQSAPLSAAATAAADYNSDSTVSTTDVRHMLSAGLA